VRHAVPAALRAARTALEDGRVDAHIDNWVQILDCLRDGRVDGERAAGAERLDDCVTALDGEQS
jgi:hypothetical protein